MKLKLAGAALCAIVLLQPAVADEHPGKAVYDKTCKECHGPEGTGNQIADNFFKVTIPRLNSEAIQGYTDAQLKGIVMGGKGKMEPVRMGAPTAPHRKGKKLTGDQINDVVAYVRTLKPKK
jgi:mono/diheme cytochrome c family protein